MNGLMMGEWYLTNYDKTHDLSRWYWPGAVNKKWDLGANFVYSKPADP